MCFIVDALDECDDGSKPLIRLISDTLSSKVRWLISSRPEVNVFAEIKKLNRQNLNRANPATTETFAELHIRGQADRIEQYLEHKLSDLRNLGSGYTDVILANVVKEVHGRAEGNMLWIHLVFQDLTDIPGSLAGEIIKDYLPGLSDLYKHKISKIQNEGPDSQKRCWDILFAVSFAYRPISLCELAALVTQSLSDLYKAVKKCDSFLTLGGESVSTIHKSARDYLQNYRSGLQRGVIHRHIDIARRSLDTMRPVLKKDVYGVKQYGMQVQDITAPKDDPLAAIHYPCVFWLHHLRDAIKYEKTLGLLKVFEDVLVFLKKHFLHWLESLSLLRSLPAGTISIRMLLRDGQVCIVLIMSAIY